MAFKTVAVVGASGSLGAPLVQALLAAGFKVTAITRETSNSTFPDVLEVRRANLGSVGSLTKAFAAQDVVIITTTSADAGNQAIYVDAALAAGVKRFIPSEFGHNTRPGKISGPFAANPLVRGKTETVDYLIAQSKAHPDFTWTGIATSPFLDWGLHHAFFGINLAAKTATIFDSGNKPVSTSTLAFVAQAVVAVLQRPDQTANQYYDVVEHAVTQNQLLALLERETGGGAGFAVTRTSTVDVAKTRDEKIAKGDPGAVLDALLAYTFADDDGARAVREEDVANALLGLKARDLTEIVRDYLKTRSA